ncbi:MAG: threonine synthase [Candidatus Omnitrophota bacterium]
MAAHGLIEKYYKFLPVSAKTPIVSLNEGGTPLIYAPSLSEIIGCKVYLKYEGLNPTGSFKDRGMTMAISKAKEEGSKAVMCASTGNTSASAAAYAARGGLNCAVILPAGAIALGKLAQALIHGAKVLAIKGNFDDALDIVREITAKYPITLVNSINPYRIEGQKTGAFEICDFLKEAPYYHAIPVGNAGNITAYWKGYKEYHAAGLIKQLPKMLGFQAKGASPIVQGKAVKNPKTLATAIKIGNPASWQQAVSARDESKGLIDAVTDKEIIAAYKLLAVKEGVFAEPASAASVAGVLKLAKSGFFHKTKGAILVCVLTGHGLKDPDRAIACVKKPKVLKPNVKLILKEIGF